MKRLTIIILTLTYSMSLLILSYTGHEKIFLNTDYSLVINNECKCLLFSGPLSTDCENSNSEDDSSADDDKLLCQFVSLFIFPTSLHSQLADKNLASAPLAISLLPPENHS